MIVKGTQLKLLKLKHVAYAKIKYSRRSLEIGASKIFIHMYNAMTVLILTCNILSGDGSIPGTILDGANADCSTSAK